MRIKTILNYFGWGLCNVLDFVYGFSTNKVVKSSLAVFFDVIFEVFIYAALGLCCVIISLFLQVYDALPKQKLLLETDAAPNEIQQTC